MEQVRRVMRPTDVPDQGLLCDLLWADPDKDVLGWGENDRGVSFTFGADVVTKFLHKHDMDLICRAHQVSARPFESIVIRTTTLLYIWLNQQELGVEVIEWERSISVCFKRFYRDNDVLLTKFYKRGIGTYLIILHCRIFVLWISLHSVYINLCSQHKVSTFNK